MALIQIAKIIKQRQDSNKLSRYRPYAKQREFHALGKTKRERLLRAGNQNGKTFSAAAEVAYHLTGRYPDWWEGRRWDRPIVCWASSESGESTRDNPQRALIGIVGEHGTAAIPADLLGIDLGLYGKASGTVDLYDYVKVKHISGGWSTLRFKYYTQGRKKWQGPPVDFVWFDEEPAEDIYQEGLARTIATGGCAALTFTPLLGMSTVVKRFLLDKLSLGAIDRGDVNMTIDDAEHIPLAERAKIIAGFAPHEREARAKGIPILGSGLIFPVSEDSITVQPFAMPDLWPRICGIDFGWQHPTAVVWLAWDRDNDIIYVYHTLRVTETTPKDIAPTIIAQGPWIPCAWPHDGLQHGKGDGVALAELYRTCGVQMLYEMATHADTGSDDESKVSKISVEAGVLDMLTRMQTGRWKVFAHCTDWFDEVRLYHRKDGQIVKLDDDVISASRYGAMMLRFATCPPDPTKGQLNPRRSHDWRAG